MLARLATLNELAPLHNPVAVECMTQALEALPGALHCAAFDTAFHRTIPDQAATYAIPAEWTERWGIRRFGFHGLSVAYAVQQVERLLGHTPARHVVCHLGAGCSVTAAYKGESIDTSMGFTPLDGVMMATRSGAVDPGMMLFLVRHGTDVDEFYDTLEHRSGLLGVSGVSSDIRAVMKQAEAGDESARLAYDMFLYSVTRAVGSMVASLGGIDVLTFTGGVGEHQPPLRRHVVNALRYLHLALDDTSNDEGATDRDHSVAGSPVRIMLVKSREDLSILREVLAVAARA
jgi:acetate kinase